LSAGRGRAPGAADAAAALASDWVRPAIRALEAYRVQPSHGLIKLDAMENPYRMPEALVPGWLERLAAVPLNRYPDAAASELKAGLRAALAVPGEAALVLGNGSDELIQLVALAVAGAGRVCLAPGPTFVMYRHLARLAGLGYVEVPLEADGFELPRERMLAAIEQHRPAVVFLAFPNNPTGNLFDAAAVEAVLAHAPGLVVIDEAYEPFAGETWMQRAGSHPRLLVMRTLSKLGLAGLRLGLLAGPGAWLEELEKARLPYNVSALTQVSVAYALEHYGVLLEQAGRIRGDRERLIARLGAIAGVAVWPSRANFVLFRVPAGAGPAVHAGLERRGVLVKSLDGAHPLLADCLRVTVGAPEETDAFLEALAAALG